jgi:hypothetical protein
VQLGAWEKLLQVALKNDALLVTFGEAAEIFRRSALSKHYDEQGL